MKSKQEVRKEYMTLRNAVSKEDNYQASAQIIEQIMEHLDFDAYEEYLLFYPLEHEINLLPLAAQLLQIGKQVAFPRVHGDTMDFYQVTNLRKDFAEGCFHVMEPQTEVPANLRSSICFVPGLVYDSRFFRLGYGKGYYDRYLSAYPQIDSAGICSNRFFLPEIPVDERDVSVDRIFTETGVYYNERMNE
ncbi:MAG: 5-formyltetrahydrofolate cyclo-ligase [Eubacterium sp.]|jgi:5-formyltetrahydrofolate cyclo-ligase